MHTASRLQSVPHVLVVDDDSGLRQQIADYLARQGMRTSVATDAAGMDEILKAEDIDVVVLDVMMPGEDGLSACRRLAGGAGPPVLILSAMGEDIDRIVGLELGADDYLPKPCHPRELLARLRVILRRREHSPQPRQPVGLRYAFAGFQLEVVRRQLRAPNGVLILLTAGEFSLLSSFLAHPERILSREQLLEMARGDDSEVFDRAIDVQISRLRRKLHGNSDREIILTYRGAGYLFDAAVKRL